MAPEAEPITSRRAFAPPPPVPPAVVKPLSPERYKIQFTVSKETHDKLRRVQDLMRHAIPNGDPAAIFDRALTVLLSVVVGTGTDKARGGEKTSHHGRGVIRFATYSCSGEACRVGA